MRPAGIQVVQDAEAVFRAAILAGVLSAERSGAQLGRALFLSVSRRGRHRLVQAPRHPHARHHDGASARRGIPGMSELRVLAASVLLAGGVAAAVSATVLRYGPEMAPGYGAHAPPRIASVRLAELAAAHAARVARAETAPGEVAVATRAWAVALGKRARPGRAAPRRGAAAGARGGRRRAGPHRRGRGGDGPGHRGPDGGPGAGDEAMRTRAIFRAPRRWDLSRRRAGRAEIALACMAVLAALWPRAWPRASM